MIDLTEPQRQSPLAIIFFGIKLVRRVGIVQVGVGLLFLWNTLLAGSLALVVLVAGAGFGTFGALSWWRSTFHVVDGELVARTGVVRADRLSVPIERIQSVAIEQELLHRMLGLVKVSVDSAGSDAAEFEIAAVTRPVAEALERQTVTAAPIVAVDDPSDTVKPDVDADEVVLFHDQRRLVRAAITMWPVSGLVLLAPLFAFGDEIGDFLFGGANTVEEEVADSARWWWIPLIVATLIVASVVLNVARVLLSDWELTLRASPQRVQRTSGLLSRTSRASSIDRIQMVTSRQNVMQRRAGLHWASFSLIGDGDVGLLGCDHAQFDDVRRRVGFAPAAPGDEDRRVHPATAWPPVRNTLAAIVVVVVVGWFVVGPWSLLATVAVAARWVAERRRAANFRWTIDHELATRRHLVSTGLDQAPLFKANAVRVTQSIFERRRGLGRVRLDTAAGSVSVGMVPVAEAEAVRDLILRATATERRPWM